MLLRLDSMPEQLKTKGIIRPHCDVSPHLEHLWKTSAPWPVTNPRMPAEPPDARCSIGHSITHNWRTKNSSNKKRSAQWNFCTTAIENTLSRARSKFTSPTAKAASSCAHPSIFFHAWNPCTEAQTAYGSSYPAPRESIRLAHSRRQDGISDSSPVYCALHTIRVKQAYMAPQTNRPALGAYVDVPIQVHEPISNRILIKFNNMTGFSIFMDCAMKWFIN